MKKSRISFILLIGLIMVSVIPLNSFLVVEKETSTSFNDQETLETAKSGGGYIMDDTATFNWIDITQTGTNMTQISDSDGYYQTIYFSSYGWSFEFYETYYDKLYVSTEGWISFSGDGWVGSEIWEIPNSQDENNDAAVLLSDWRLDPEVGGDIYYEFRGSSPNRHLVIEYHQIHTESGDLLGDFEAIFYENGTIKFQYLNVYTAVNHYDLCIGLDHGDSVNYNKYEIQELPISNLAIQFQFDKLEEVDFSLWDIEGGEYSWITTQIEYDKVKTFLGDNWEAMFGFSTVPKRGFKIKKTVNSITEYAENKTIAYSYWDWIDRRMDFSDTPSYNGTITYKKDPQKYDREHNLTNTLPLALPLPVDVYVSQANLTNNYQARFEEWRNVTRVEFNVGKEVNGTWTHLKMNGYYNMKGILEYMDFTFWNESTRQETKVFGLESFGESYLEKYNLKIYELMDYKWQVDLINTQELESILGSNWEEKFGLPPNPEEGDRMQIKMKDTSQTRDKWNVKYEVWDWRSSDRFTDGSYADRSISYLKDPFNYQELHTLQDTFPIFIPNPGGTYLSSAYLNTSVYSNINYDSQSNNTWINSWNWMNISGREINLDIHASYNFDGIKTDMNLYVNDHQTGDGSDIFRMHLYDYDDRPPDIWVERPQPNEEYGTTPPNFSIHVEDQYLDEIWYSLDGGQTNILCEEHDQIKEELWARLEDGPVTITFYANDMFYRKSERRVAIIKDSSISRSNEFDILESIPGYNVTLLISSISAGAVLISWRIKKNKESE